MAQINRHGGQNERVTGKVGESIRVVVIHAAPCALINGTNEVNSSLE